jgi:pimeloyl-ACP methyl ester carboxylesterase
MASTWASLTSSVVEASAFVRQAFLLPRDTLAPVVPRTVDVGDDVVVFVHGLFASAGVLRPMRTQIGRHAGVKTAALSYAPGPGAEAMAERLAEHCAALPAHAHLHLVGHSLGGIVARYYAAFFDDARVVQTIALAAPFGGVPGARWLGFDGARDIDEASLVLRRLKLMPPKRDVPHLSIVAGSDGFARSPVSHALPGGDVVVLEGRGHNTLLFDREAIGLVERRVLSVRLQRPSFSALP